MAWEDSGGGPKSLSSYNYAGDLGEAHGFGLAQLQPFSE